MEQNLFERIPLYRGWFVLMRLQVLLGSNAFALVFLILFFATIPRPTIIVDRSGPEEHLSAVAKMEQWNGVPEATHRALTINVEEYLQSAKDMRSPVEPSIRVYDIWIHYIANFEQVSSLAFNATVLSYFDVSFSGVWALRISDAFVEQNFTGSSVGTFLNEYSHHSEFLVVDQLLRLKDHCGTTCAHDLIAERLVITDTLGSVLAVVGMSYSLMVG